jgi:ABC-type cobalamin/Fe3+-siderophores transport system ATPase subunit
LEEQNSILRTAFKIQHTDPDRLDYVDTKNPQTLHINKLKEKFKSLPDEAEEERSFIACELVELGETNYKKYVK